jgi:hypothetical protein
MLSGTDPSAQGQAMRDELVELVSAKYPFDIVVEDFVAPFHPTACNHSIRDLGFSACASARGRRSLRSSVTKRPY